MRTKSLAGLCISLACAVCANGDTTISVTSTVHRASVKRLGINLGKPNYWDAMIMKNLVFKNPGLEEQIYQSTVRCVSGSATTCVSEWNSWPTGFWDGATFEMISGTSRGRTGTISRSTASSSSTQTGSTFTFADSGTAPATGDYMILRKPPMSGLDRQWIITQSQGGVVAVETADLSPDTVGRQAVRLTTTSSSQVARLLTATDTMDGFTFLQLNGDYRLSFLAKGLGGANNLRVRVRRTTNFVDRTILLSGFWAKYNIDFTAGETGNAIGHLQLEFGAANSSSVLIDDVTLTQTNTDVNNTTSFRDPVVNALKTLNPGILRYWGAQLGDTLDNQIAPAFGRLRSGYASYGTETNVIEYGLHEFLELCEHIQAEPWYVVPITFSTTEMTNLMEYLGGPSSATYGGKRAGRGRSAPWTDAFAKIHLEFGNEAWNSVFKGGSIEYSIPYGNRGSEIFGIAKASPYYSNSKFDLVLGGQHVFIGRNRDIHNASANHDTLALAPYMGGRIDDFSNNEDLFGSLFAEVELESQSRYMRQNLDMMKAASRPVPLSIYEVNLHTTLGSVSQAALDSFTPSLGAGLAVANHMLMMLRDLGIKDQMLFSFAQYRFLRTDNKTVLLWGATRDVGVRDLRRPQFLALQLANEAIMGDLLQTTHSGDDPTWNQPLKNGIQLNNAHYLQSYAFSRGRDRAIVLFNFSRTQNYAVNFTGANAPTGAVTLKRLTSTNITDNNENSEVVRITSETMTGFDSARSLSLPQHSMTVLSWQTGDPILEITLSKTTYAEGDTLTLTEFRPRNPRETPATVRLEVWFSIPGLGKLPLIDVGSDGSFQFPANLNTNAGPFSLFQLTAGFPPRGNWEINSRITDPATAAVLGEDINPFVIQ